MYFLLREDVGGQLWKVKADEGTRTLQFLSCVSIGFSPAFMSYPIFLFLLLCSNGVATPSDCYTGDNTPFP